MNNSAKHGAAVAGWTSRPSYPWIRLAVSLALTTVASVGMYIVVVVLPEVQAEFGTARTGASFPYTLTMIGFGLGGVIMGRLSDRHGVVLPVIFGALALVTGMVLAAMSGSILLFTLASALVGVGVSATFSPLIADTALWFTRHRGTAVAICASGNYLSGTIWPPIIQRLVEAYGWRASYIGIGVFSIAVTLLLVWVLRPRAPVLAQAAGAADTIQSVSSSVDPNRPLGMAPNTLQTLLCIAGVACCVAMSMPQVHIVALCSDLGYGAQRGAEMLSVMLACGIASRLVFGWLSDRIGGLRTLFLSASLQAVALIAFLPNQSLGALFFASALFGLFQGGIVPSYAIVVREHFRPKETGTRVALAITATLLGMAFGGWASGLIYDLTGSYDEAFVHGILWNLVTIAIAGLLILRSGPRLKARLA